ncbi:hypothetical protein AMS68_006746 [Peltaster fructicola]|uniref:Uncharacterized protein n=1 Tax=Peltaster fructicola TaxID=286661 RepID=A0A6H0Y2Z6_9PEZI|nr:hypothetical protein AMS68_006746 [Peltaster fructicola]
MSKACSSPTARLFQNSRLFSIPKPLPSAVRADTQASGSKRDSDTATTPYPTHQAITSPHSSRAIDFASAGDHTVTLEKFQELSIPLVTRSFKQSSYNAKKNPSVYEDALDNTDRSKAGRRWRTNGPYLLEMGAKELDRYLKEVEAQRPEWLEYLREYFAQRSFDTAKKESIDKTGFFGPADLQPLNIRADCIIREAESELQATRGTEADSSAFHERQRTVMEAARERAEQCRAQLELQTAQAGAVEHLREADRRSTAIMDFAQQKMRQAEEELPAEARDRDDRIEVLNSEYEDAKEQTNGIKTAAYEDVISTFGERPDATSIDTLESHARRLFNESVASTAATELAREQTLKQWEESAKLADHYPDAQKLQELQKELRDAHGAEKMHSELASLLVSFLDLPGMGETTARAARLDRAASLSRTTNFQESLLQHGFMESSPSDKEVPLSTHPGAGLGYLRASVHMENHPVYGPQAQRSAVLSRVLKARASVTGTDFHAKLGVAGFVASDPKGTGVNTTRNNAASTEADSMAASIDPYLVGGNKMYMQADSAFINQDGQVILGVTRPDKEAVAVKTGDVKEILDNKKATLTGTSFASMSGSFLGLPDPRLPRAKYGTGVSNYRSAPQKS